MDRPSHVTILGQRFAIEYAHNDDTGRPLLASELQGGRMSLAHQRIAIDTDQGEDQLRDTLLHEVLHACRSITHLDLKDDDEEERVIRAMSPVLLDALRSSPGVTAFLFGDT